MHVWQTPLRDAEQTVNIGRILHVAYDPDRPDAPATVWHESDPTRDRVLYLRDTGSDVPSGADYRGTAVGTLGWVFHVFEKLERP